MCTNPFCLGEYWCSEWGCCERTEADMDDLRDPDFEEPPSKRKKTKLQGSRTRFASPVSPGKMQQICKGFVPANTKKATTWALRAFEQWRDERNKSSCSEKCPVDLLEKPSAEALNRWLPRFVVEARREDGNPYPPSTISNLLAGLYRYSKDCDRNCPNFMNRKDATFKELTGALEVKCRELRQEGVGAVVKHAAVFTPAEENALWERKVIGDHNAVALQRAVFFYAGKAFCLRGGQEQRDLKISQFLRSTDPDCFTYVENGSKNRSGVNTKEANKVVPVYASPSSRPRCLVYLLDLYLSKLPAGAKDRDVFYLRPAAKVPASPGAPWYERTPVGREKLRTFVASMCQEAGIAPKTNHSLRATGATALFTANVPEKMIKEVTGHRSNALQLYERPTLQQKQAVSSILVQGNAAFAAKAQKENLHPVPVCQAPRGSTQLQQFSNSVGFNSLFSGLNHCNFVVNVGVMPTVPTITSTPTGTTSATDEDFRGIDLEDFANFE